jgi:hypothetical protein
MKSIDSLQYKKLPDKGADRYFTWLVKLQSKLKLGFQLRDLELMKMANKINRICK